MSIKLIKIKTPKGWRSIGPGQPVFIIAEMSCNHHQSYRQARKIIDEAAEAGVDAIKLQTFRPEGITIDSDNKYFQIKVNEAWKGQTLFQLYKKVYTPWEWQPKLKKYAESKGLVLFSTPSVEDAVDFLEKMDVVIYKVGSFEVVDLGLLKKIGQTKKPVIISRGMASAEEINLAIKTLKKAGAPHVAVLHCVSSYPALPAEMNLATIPDIAKRFGVISGLSDHTLGTTVALTSIGLGACIIEKHLTLRRADGGPDAAFSLEPYEMKELVRTTREAEAAIGEPTYQTGKKEAANKIFRRSLFIIIDVKKGEKLSNQNVRSIRPGYGLAPKYLEKILGRTAVQDFKKGTPLAWKMISKK
jgi:pseudaminic acid synthase